MTLFIVFVSVHIFSEDITVWTVGALWFLDCQFRIHLLLYSLLPKAETFIFCIIKHSDNNAHIHAADL